MSCPGCGQSPPDGARFCPACGAALAAIPTGGDGLARPKETKRSGCWIAALVAAVLLVVAIPFVGIVAAIAIPNLLNAIDRGKQKRTLADIRYLSSAIEGFAEARGTYPVADDIEELRGILRAVSDEPLPGADGWGRPFRVESGPDGYAIYSTGKDGVPDGCPGGETDRFDADLCLEDGELTQFPTGLSP